MQARTYGPLVLLVTFGVLTCLPVVRAADPPASTQPSKTAPKDATMDWLLGQGKPGATPSTDPVPATKPATPFEEDDKLKQLGYRKGMIQTSSGEKFYGMIATTAEKPVRIWDDEKKVYRDVPFNIITKFEAKVVWEREEKEWHFRESGSDIKEYSGKTYPAHELVYTLTLVNGQTVTGGSVAPLYLELPGGEDKTFVLHKRDKGQIGQTLKDLVYVKLVEFKE